jgi:hypothetical protein
MIGKPTHLLKNKVSACGLVSPAYGSDNYTQVDCLSCIKTKEFKKLAADHKKIMKHIIVVPSHKTNQNL